MTRPKKTERVGETKYNNQGELMTIIEYNGRDDITVEFQTTHKTKKCHYHAFKVGYVHDDFYPSVDGVGYIGGASTKDESGNRKRSYNIWVSMIHRCYNDKFLSSHPYYQGCSVHTNWHCYANFEKWYDDNYYEVDGEETQLDKDILVKGNKLYSQETCVFVPARINSLFINRRKLRGRYPIGVTYDRYLQKFTSQVSGMNHMRCCDTPEEAFELYKIDKEQFIKDVADEYKEKIPQKLYDAMYKYEIEITD